MRLLAGLVAIAAATVAAGCGGSKPSTQDARVAFERELRAQVSPAARILDFEKSDGLAFSKDGIESYDLEFEANVEVPGGRFERDLYRGTVRFIRTEAGWRSQEVTGKGQAQAAAEEQVQRNKAAIAKIAHDVRMLEIALTLYKLDNFGYPSIEQGLRALIEEPTTEPRARNWKADGYVKSLPLDPWGNEYRFEIPGKRGESDVDIYSLGADGAPGGDGPAADLGNWLYRP